MVYNIILMTYDLCEALQIDETMLVLEKPALRYS